MTDVVADTSPLRYLIAVGRPELLSQLFHRVLIPPAVLQELSHPHSPLPVSQWIVQRPAWLKVYPLVEPLDPVLAASLDQGEAEAIQLAEQMKSDALILDEWKGRSVAQRWGLPLTGTLGILGVAYQKGFLENPVPTLAAMRKEGFRIHDQLASRFPLLLRTEYSR